MEERKLSPTILIDLAKDRIRIHRVTLSALQNPEYILLIVNPAEKSLGIMRSSSEAPGAHKVKCVGKLCYELYSKSLVQKFREVCPNWLETGKYRMTGNIVPGAMIAQFSMSAAEFKGTGKVS